VILVGDELMTDRFRRAASYVRHAAAARVEGEKATDPAIAAEYLILAARWLRLAEEASSPRAAANANLQLGGARKRMIS
jgi:hypothetical protein